MNRKAAFSILAALAILLVVAATTGVVVWRLARRAVTTEVLRPVEKKVDLSTLVTQVRELHRLETAAMRVVHVGRISQSYKLVPNALAGDEITFLATGDVIAGIDLARLQKSDVWRDADGTIHLRLPPSQILVTRVDNDESRVLHRDTGMLRRADVDLETRARQHAEANIRKEAIRKGILPLASQNAEKKLADFLHTLGFEKVRFVSGAGVPREQL